VLIRCVSFGSLWWLRPGNDVADPLRFSLRAAIFNTTGFISNSRERRLWHVAGVVRINLGMHSATHRADDFVTGCFESTGIERRGEWNRLLLGRRLRDRTIAETLCAQSRLVGRIDFEDSWHGPGIEVISASAFRGVQETLMLAFRAAEFQTDQGLWEVTWNGFIRKK
jgi:hypothetical protein